MAVYSDITALVGDTPLVRLARLEKKYGLRARLYGKLECANPAGSAKDRAALFMLEQAEREGRITHGATVIEPTSGNTGLSLAALCAARGYRMVLVMPDTMSVERQQLARAYGAEVVLTPGALGMAGSIERAQAIAAETDNSIIPSQFDNPANPDAHYATTGPELVRDLGGDLAVFVAAVGTGGTLSGTGRYLKETIPHVRVVGVEPSDSPLLTEGRAGAHKIQGIGANFVPANYDPAVPDEIVTATWQDAYDAARTLARTEGLLVGISSGAALTAAIAEAKNPAFADRSVVALLPDGGERYLSTDLFQ